MVDLVKLFDLNKLFKEGVILFLMFLVDLWYWNFYVYFGFFDVNKKIKDYIDEEYDMLLYGKDIKVFLEIFMGSMNVIYEGLILKFNCLYI